MEYVSDLVSVIIPTYKRSEMLGRAIQSVLNQSYREIEVIIVSDNEPDDEFTHEAQKVVESFRDERAHLITQPKHINGAAARNAGIREAKGEYIAFLDDDDYWEIKKVELQVKLIKSLDSTYGGVTCKNKHYCDGKLVSALPPIREKDLCKNVLLRLADLSTDAILLKRKCLDETGYFDEKLKRHQEVQLMTFFTAKYKVKLLDMYLVCVDSTKNENQPNPKAMEKVKADFLEAVAPVLELFSIKEQHQIRTMHKFECGLQYVKAHQFGRGLKLCASVLMSPKTVGYAFRYIKKKIKAQSNAKRRVENDAYTLLKKEMGDQ